MAGRVEVCWGDLRRIDEVQAAMSGQDVVIHLAFIIPKLSHTGYESEDHPEWAREVNVGGTANLIAVAEAQARAPRFLFASSYHIYGRTQDQAPPRSPLDTPQPIEHYAWHKVESEEMLRASELEWAILRLAAALPFSIKLDPGMFDIPLDNRMEYVHTRDVGLAFARAVSSPDVWGRILLIGGGARCQYTYGEITEKVLTAFGVGVLPEEAFGKIPFPTDWLDTSDSQQLLNYQRHTLDDYVEAMRAQLGLRRHVIRLFRRPVRYLLLKQSMHYRAGRPSRFAVLMQGFKMLKGKPRRVKVG
jgi:nucleoside-diphosphate-sugar epimerase